MKLLRQFESRAMEFEGRTSEEAITYARRELGNDIPIRCWSVRQGGLFGFFAKETFIAGLTLPEPLIKKEGTLGSQASEENELSVLEPVGSTHSAKASLAEWASLANLIERTEDQVTLSSSDISETDFSEILAEAEATLNEVSFRETKLLSNKTPEPFTPQRIQKMRDRLIRIGVPVEYVPDQPNASLDELAHAIAKLPRMPELPAIDGSLVVIAGRRQDAQTAAKILAPFLGCEASDVIEMEKTVVSRQRILRRRLSKKSTILVVDAPLRSRELTEVSAWVTKLRPDYVMGALSATAKSSDILRWQDELGRIDALMLTSLGNTSTPGELMGQTPIAFIDGERATTMRWVLALLGWILEGQIEE